MPQKTFAIALMDPPYESENLTTAFRILDVMAQRGHNINVFAYEGASGLAFAKQTAHPNPMQGAGAEHTVVLRGNAVNYAVAGQGAPGLTIGGWKQTHAPRMDNDVVDLIERRKIPVFVIEEDLAARGIERGELVPGVQLLS